MTTVFLADAPTPANHARPAHASPAAAQRWSVQAVLELLDRPFMDLLWQAQEVHRQHWPAGDIELATLLSVKTDRKSTRLNSSHSKQSRMPSSA